MAGKNDERVIYLEERKAHEEAAVSNNAKARRFDEILMENKRISETYINGNAGVTTPTVTTPTAAAPQKAMTYEQYLSQYGINPEYMQAQSYADYLTRTGMAGAAQKQYDATVRAAETDYEKSKAMYGANAEALGRAGLTGSGYGDYLTGAGFSAMQGAKVAAADTKALTEAQQRSDYANYLMGVEQTNAQIKAQADAANEQAYTAYMNRGNEAKGVIDSLMSQGMDDASIKAYIQQHYGTEFDGYVDGWISNAHTYSDPLIAEAEAKTTKAETDAADAEALKRAQAAYSALLEGYQSGAIVNKATADSELKRAGYTQAEIDVAVAEYGAGVIQRLSANMNLSGATLADVPTTAQIDDLVTTDQITQAQADAFKIEAQKRRAALLKADFDKLQDADPATANTEADKLFAQIDAYSDDDLPPEARAELYKMRAQAYLNTSVDTNEPVALVLDAYVALGLDDDDANEAAREGYLEGLAAAIEITGVSSAATKKHVIGGAVGTVAGFINPGLAGVGTAVGALVGADYAFAVNAGKDSKGKDATENIGVRVRAASDDEVAMLGEGTNTPKVIGNALYIYDGKWKKVTRVTTASVGSKQAAKAMYDVLLDYYS